MSATDCAYAAGIIDGEGSITGRIIEPRAPKLTTRFVARLTVAMTNLDLLVWLAGEWGGKPRIRTRIELEVTHRRPVYVWEVTAHNMAAVLRDTLPYLRVKHEQAVLALALHERHHHRGGARVVPIEELAERRRLALAIREANRAA